MTDPIIDVAVGVLLTDNGKVLLGDRPAGKPWAGWWELPGGKLEPGESVMQALGRELKEELGIELTDATPWVTYIHRYPTTTVRLHFCRVTGWVGEPQTLEQQQLKWVDIATATELPDLLPAAYPPLRWLKLPSKYLISSAHSSMGHAAFLDKLQVAMAQGVKLVQWREPAWDTPDMHAVFEQVKSCCHAHGAKLLINSVHDKALWHLADGVHLRAEDAKKLSGRPVALQGKLVGVSTHNEQELAIARAIEADFVVLGPVLPTASHPGAATLGWDEFERLNQLAGLPAFAIGGQSSASLALAQSRGAHGIAGIAHLID
ncbi:Nudix family hydrolase [Orrella daihaiensis]|uniref:8-oxo-dGTP diphosphatase n=1 Tax=Orrella daihaiensis TaxID=2782176 RepID=A0ABY4AQQ2_9BURK|nr:Nudix family hydrolase [Orrella daihaiensis]UOD51695.1 Nudix family hydrolase [Orrella daihaiensis]